MPHTRLSGPAGERGGDQPGAAAGGNGAGRWARCWRGRPRPSKQAVGAERVYVLSFCEVDRRLHFHLFPRTAWLLKEYFKANFNANEPIDGPMLFAWARGAFGPGSHMPKGTPDMAAVGAAIRGILEQKE